MRRIALLGLFVLLPGCQYVGDPTVGAGGFIHDTVTLDTTRTVPPAVAENEKLAEGEPVTIRPLHAEHGEVWPGPPPPIPTLQDVQSLTNLEFLPPANIPQGPAPAVFPQNAPQNGPQSVSPPGTKPSMP